MRQNLVLATDLDGTLFYPRKRVSMIPAKSRAFLNRFMDDGGRLLIVSGRNRYMAEKVAKNLGRPIDAIGCNGAFITCNGATIREIFFQTARLKEILNYIGMAYRPHLTMLMSKTRNLVVSKTDTTKFTNLGYYIYEHSMGTYKEPYVRSDRIFAEELNKGEVYKILVLMGLRKKKKLAALQANKELRLRFPDAEFSWLGEFIEISSGGCSKGEGIAFYLDYNKIKHDNVLVVGDSGNDISMFEAFPKHSYCMAHGPLAVRKHASATIKRFYDLQDCIYPSEESNHHPEKAKKKRK